MPAPLGFLLVDAVPVAAQAAHLCKADLATSMVTEMTALAGTMGRHYAAKEGLPQGAWAGLHAGCAGPAAAAAARVLWQVQSWVGALLACPLPPPTQPSHPPWPAAVADAIFESVLPRNAGDELPQTPAGLLVSLADKCAGRVWGLWARGEVTRWRGSSWQ